VPRDGRTIPEIRDVDERRQSRTHGGSPREIGLPIRLRAATGIQSQMFEITF